MYLFLSSIHLSCELKIASGLNLEYLLIIKTPTSLSCIPPSPSLILPPFCSILFLSVPVAEHSSLQQNPFSSMPCYFHPLFYMHVIPLLVSYYIIYATNLFIFLIFMLPLSCIVALNPFQSLSMVLITAIASHSLLHGPDPSLLLCAFTVNEAQNS